MSYKIFLDHIGVATPNIESDNFFSLLGLKAGGEELVASENVNVSFFRTENGANIELLQPYPEGEYPKGRGSQLPSYFYSSEINRWSIG